MKRYKIFITIRPMSYSTNLHQNPSLDSSDHHSGPSGIRIQRRINATEQPFGPPPTVPLETEVTEQEKDPVAQTSSGATSTLTKTNTTRRGKERVKEKERENEADKENKDKERPTHTPLGERTSYVEEPSSTTTTLERCDRKLEKERALVRRITNEMQIAQYVHKMEIAQTSSAKPTGAFSPGVYRIRSLRFFENGLRRSLWYLGKSIANHELFFTVLPIFLLSLSLIGPIVHKDKLSIYLPFSLLTGGASDIISNGYGIHWAQKNFNYSNPAFSTLNHMDQNSFSILLKTMYVINENSIHSNKDTILRKDAVLAYTSLKKKLDGYPFLESCPLECETDKEMVDKIIKKSPQVINNVYIIFLNRYKCLIYQFTCIINVLNIPGVDTDTDGAISRAQALLMSFQLRDDLSQEQNNAWQNNFIDQVKKFNGATSYEPIFYISQLSFKERRTIFMSFNSNGFRSTSPLLPMLRYRSGLPLLSLLGWSGVSQKPIAGLLFLQLYLLYFVLLRPLEPTPTSVDRRYRSHSPYGGFIRCHCCRCCYTTFFRAHVRLLISKAFFVFRITPVIIPIFIIFITSLKWLGMKKNFRVDIKEEFFLPSASPSREFLEQYREMFGKTIQYLEASPNFCLTSF
uniref:SSD domain-containing protein n=1 Tax=Heterorhabditis bacteriophora TaxID=37862 RepID=A0A1I7XST8_HETBA